jgi:hypothetical protein
MLLEGARGHTGIERDTDLPGDPSQLHRQVGVVGDDRVEGSHRFVRSVRSPGRAHKNAGETPAASPW